MTVLKQSKLEPSICIPVVGKSIKEFIGNMKRAQKKSSVIELRVDFIKDLKPGDLTKIKININQKSIFTCRKKSEGGQFQESEVKRITLIERALGFGFDYIDIELSTLHENQLNLSKKGKTKLIVSYHNFKETPNQNILNTIIEDIKKYHPDIIKIATQVIKPEDNYKLFKLILSHTIDLPRIIIGMGKLGKTTRIIGPILGGYLTFASVQNKVTAPEQIEINQLKKIYRLMGL